MPLKSDSPDAADADYAYASHAADDSVAYPKSIHLFLCNWNHKMVPNTKKKNTTPNTDVPDADPPIATEHYSTYPYTLRNHWCPWWMVAMCLRKLGSRSCF